MSPVRALKPIVPNVGFDALCRPAAKGEGETEPPAILRLDTQQEPRHRTQVSRLFALEQLN